MGDDFEDIQRLIRLKRYEKPPEGFVDDFLLAFQHRQRAELLQKSARGLLWERMATYFDGLLNPKFAWGAAAAAVVGIAALSLQQSGQDDQGALTASNQAGEAFASTFDATLGKPITDEEAAEYLLSRHYDGLFNERYRGNLTQSPQVDSEHFTQPFNPDAGSLLPVGFTLEMPK